MKYKVTVIYRLKDDSDRIPDKIFEFESNHQATPDETQKILKERLGSKAMYVKSYVQEKSLA